MAIPRCTDRHSAALLAGCLLCVAAPGYAGPADVKRWIGDLRSPKVAVRTDAAAALAAARDRSAVPALITATGDREASVRGQALRALAATATRSDLPALIGALRDPLPFRRAAAATVLGILADPRAEAALERASD